MTLDEMLAQWKLCMPETVLPDLTMVLIIEIEKVIDEWAIKNYNTKNSFVINELKEKLGIKEKLT